MNSSESAESVVRMTLQGVEVVAKISGSGAKELAIMLCAILNGKHKIKGKTTLTNMLKSGKELKVFSVKQGDLKKFTEEAKRYGILFSVLVEKKNKNPDGIVDIMVRAEDASKINRIVDRFNLATIDQAKLKSEIEKEKIEKVIKESEEKGIEVQDVDDLIADIYNEPHKEEGLENPTMAMAEKSPLSEPSLENKKSLEEGTKTDKPSVRKELQRIKEEQSKSVVGKEDKKVEKEKTKTTKYKGTKNKKKIKNKERGR